jgi:hypothetical protein
MPLSWAGSPPFPVFHPGYEIGSTATVLFSRAER